MDLPERDPVLYEAVRAYRADRIAAIAKAERERSRRR
jgi:hypothetical protein